MLRGGRDLAAYYINNLEHKNENNKLKE